MQNRGSYPVWLTGSHKTVWRVVYREQDGTEFIKWYGQMIEVVRGFSGYYQTAEQY